MSLLTVAEARALVESTLSDSELQDVIDRIEADITAKIGAAYDGSAISETVEGGYGDIFLKRAIGSISSITERATLDSTTTTTMTTSDYYTWGKQGRITRLPRGSIWGAAVTVSYVPTDDSEKWKMATVDLLKMTLARSPLMSESVGGELSYTRPENWELEKRRIIRRLSFVEI